MSDTDQLILESQRDTNVGCGWQQACNSQRVCRSLRFGIVNVRHVTHDDRLSLSLALSLSFFGVEALVERSGSWRVNECMNE